MADAAFELTAARYGKDKVRVLRVVRGPNQHEVVEYNVCALVEGKIETRCVTNCHVCLATYPMTLTVARMKHAASRRRTIRAWWRLTQVRAWHPQFIFHFVLTDGTAVKNITYCTSYTRCTMTMTMTPVLLRARQDVTAYPHSGTLRATSGRIFAREVCTP